jgi:hypothetical protein
VSIVYAVEALFLRLSIVLFYDEVHSFRKNYGTLHLSKFRGRYVLGVVTHFWPLIIEGATLYRSR